MDGIPEAEPVHFGGMLCCGGRSSPRRLSTGMDVGRWAIGGEGGGPWTIRDKAEHFWMCEECYDWEDW